MSFLNRTSLTVVGAPVSTVPKCGKCKLFEGCTSEKMPESGEGRKGIYIVGEAPGEDEDAKGIQFVGKTGIKLQDVLEDCGIDIRKDCWSDNALRCHPPNNEIEDKKRISYCRPNVLNAIRRLKPRIVILLGAVAVESVIGSLWKDKTKGIGKWAGFQIPHQKSNTWICPTYHPSYVVRMLDQKDKIVARDFARHIKEAVELKGRPWKEIPNYEEEIQIILDDKEAARVLRSINSGSVISFDFESDRLKPDHQGSQIVSCSVCSSEKGAIAFPWYGEVIERMEAILRDTTIKKIGHNVKHEQRWVHTHLRFRVKGWIWDSMLAAHALDPRGGISSLKFQSFVQLGMGDYDSHIKPYLFTKGKGGNFKNRVKELDLNTLLLYNGLDSLLTYKLAQVQMRKLRNASTTNSM